MRVNLARNSAGVTRFLARRKSTETSVIRANLSCVTDSWKPELLEDEDSSDLNDLNFEDVHNIIKEVISTRTVRMMQTDIIVDLTVTTQKKRSDVCEICNSSPQMVTGRVCGPLLQELYRGLNLEEMKLQLVISFEDLPCHIVTQDLSSEGSSAVFLFEQELCGTLKVLCNSLVHFSIAAELTLKPQRSPTNEVAERTKAYLETGVVSDFSLISGEGVSIPCHKILLENCSEFFKGLLHSGMKEVQEGKCRLGSSSKEGLEALLKFVYSRDVEDALASSELAYELLEFGLTYQISGLDDVMKNIFLWKESEWWDTQVAFEVFLRVRHLEGCGWELLKKKAMDVLKSKNYMLMSDSDTRMEKLWSYDSKAAKELMQFWFKNE
ncbi:unnamed protein product [Orchesella dallaii]|uniref:BTB domain-containing protein n=1 Tax=Orchesella dallaii TaxID=48710 RepID=A0ABP1RYX2_9HEXA